MLDTLSKSDTKETIFITENIFDEYSELKKECIELAGENIKLRQKQHELDTAFENIDQVLFSVDMINYTLIYTSAATEKLYGYSQKEFYENETLWQDIIHEEDKHISFRQVNDLSAGKQIYNQYRIFRKDGEMRWIENRITPTLDENNILIRFDGVTTDITERKSAENETLRLLENLQSINKDLQQFAYIVSHNLRSPIAKLIGMTDMLKCGILNDEETANLTESINLEAHKLDLVVKDMNTIVAARDKDTEIKEEVSFSAALEAVTDHLKSEIEESGAVVEGIFNPDKLITIKSYIHSIMYNLVSNAIKYRRQDIQPEVRITSKKINDNILLSVTDNGLGIDLDKHKDKLFGLYKRFHSGSIPGRGIGLNIVKMQAKLLGGDAHIESVPMQGSTFHVTLPEYICKKDK